MRRVCCAGLVLTTAISLAARQTPPASQKPPVFKSSTDVVQLDVSVIDKDRHPVRGLTQSDFTVFEDGAPQSIVAFDSIDLPDVTAPTAEWMTKVSPDITTNSVDESRIFVIVLDDAMAINYPPVLQSAKKVAHSIVAKMGPKDIATVIFTRDNRKPQNFTADKARLNAAIDGFTVGFVFGGNGDALYFQMSIRTVREATDYLLAIPQRRKALVYISIGLPLDPATLANDRDGTQQEMFNQMTEAFRRAERGNVNVYAIDPAGLGGLEDYCRPPKRVPCPAPSRVFLDFLQIMADNTGGHAIINTNDFEPGITEMFVENSSYYLLGYRASNTKRDGTIRKLEVKVNRPGVEVRTRKSYVAEDADKLAKDAKKKEAASPLATALAEIRPKADLPLRIAAAPFAVPGKPAVVTLALGVRQPAQTTRVADDLELLIKAFTPEGNERGSATQAIQIVVPPARRGSDFTRYDVLSQIELKPGRYELRVSTNSAVAGKDGSVYADVEVPDFEKAPVSLSGAVLSVTPGVPVAPADAFKSILPVVPSTERAFARFERVAAFFRIYQGGKGTPAPVMLATSILDNAGAKALEKTETIASAQFTTTRSADVTFPLPLAELAPGEYLLSFTATIDKNVARRDVRFTVK